MSSDLNFINQLLVEYNILEPNYMTWGELEIYSFKWWVLYFATLIQEDGWHILIELACLITILYLICRNPSRPEQQSKLTKKEEEELIKEWKPLPLVTSFEEDEKSMQTELIVECSTGPTVTINGGRVVTNFLAQNFLGIADRDELKDAAKKVIEVVGVGSCGPRGFYGSFDIHMDLEKKISEFMGVNEAILYSDSIACISSVIPAFAKRGDFIVMDESVSFGVQQGVSLSRSKLFKFKHNDMKHLEDILISIISDDKKYKRKLNRRFVVVEGVYQQHGDLAPLNKIVDLCQKYHFRLCVDDSFGFGVLGKTGRGSPEHWNVPISKIDMYAASLDTTISSIGGFCIGGIEWEVVDHQRLSGAGYCYSAAAPPYTSAASITAIDIIMEEGEKDIIPKSRDNCTYAHELLNDIDGLIISGTNVKDSIVSPCIHLRLEHELPRDAERRTLIAISEMILEQYDIAVRVPNYVPNEMNPPRYSIVVYITAAHSKEQIEELADALSHASNAVLGNGPIPKKAKASKKAKTTSAKKTSKKASKKKSSKKESVKKTPTRRNKRNA